MSALYRQVCEQILAQITGGKRQVGDRLPPEAEFAVELGISRSTLRLAFAELEAAGVLRRRKRAGTQIISDKPQKRFSMATSGVHELLSLGRNTSLTVTSVKTVSTQEIALLQTHHSDTDQWLEISGSRTLQGEATPFSVNQVYVPARFSSIESLLTKNETSVYQIIENTFDVTVARVAQTTTAIACPKHEAKIMSLAAATPVLRIDAALYLQDNSLMEVSKATFDSNRFQLQSEVEIG